MKQILGVTSIKSDVGFFKAGMDSLMVEELSDKIQKDIGKGFIISPTHIFQYPNIESLANYLEETLFPESEKIEKGTEEAQELLFQMRKLKSSYKQN